MAELMTMRDIAALAQVQRPVVTVWRRRSRGSDRPFPQSRERRHDQELFLRREVVSWLEATGRGNNPDVRADAAAYALSTLEPADLAGLSALITLRHLAGQPLVEAGDDLLDLADAHDPDDQYLFGELEQLHNLTSLALTAEEMLDAAWNTDAAHHRLLDAWLRKPGEPLAQVALAPSARRLLADSIGALAADLGQPALMDPTGCLGDLFADLAAGQTAPGLVMAGHSPSHRLARRQLLLADAPHRLVDRGSGDWSVAGPVAHLVVLPAADAPALPPLDQLDLIDEIALQADGRQLALCLAPAATLTDPLGGEALSRRDQLLRAGHVRAVVRLPAGCRPAQVREHFALWLLGAADQTPRADRWTMVADLSDQALGDLGGLVDDLVAAWQGSEGARRRAWACLHPVPTRDLVSASGSLVSQRTPRAPRASAGAGRVVRLRASDAEGRLAGYRLSPLDLPAEILSIAQALERGWLRLIPGRRFDPRGLPAGSVPVVDDPRRPWPEAPRVDRLSLLGRAGVEFTEPGDVVFTVRPRPAAVVDTEGGSFVLTPARVLRLAPGAPLLPDTVAARINAATTWAWRSWQLAAVPVPDRDALGEALAELTGHRARLLADLAALDALTDDLIDAVESRQLSITKENHGATSL